MKTLVISFVLLFCVGVLMGQSLSNYSFAHETGTYTEISGGILLGNESTADQRFVDPAVPLGGSSNTGLGFPIGFKFYFNGYEFDRVGVSAEGWIALGQSHQPTAVYMTSTSQSLPLSSSSGITPTWLVSRISGLGVNLMAQTGASLRIETIGTAPNRIFVAQWKNYRKSSANGDSFNFQIRLEEGTNIVRVIYGDMLSNATVANVQVGLRGEPAATATNYRNRSTATDWMDSAEGGSATATCTLSDTVFPAPGTTFAWTPPTPISGTWTIGGGGTFESFTAAINFLNLNIPSFGIGSGGITFNVSAGEIFTEFPPTLSVSGFEGKPILIQRFGTGNNPLVLVDGSTGTSDAAFRLDGSDYVTFDGIDIANIAGSSRLEYGWFLNGIAYNGCLNNTIKNGSVTLSRTNTNTRGVLITGVANGSSNSNLIHDLVISDCNTGIRNEGNTGAAFHNTANIIYGNSMSDISAYGYYQVSARETEFTDNSIAMATSNNVSFYGVYVTGANSDASIEGNVITGGTTSTGYSGLHAYSGTYTWSGNSVSGFSGTGAATRYGMYVYDGNNTITGNDFHTLSGVGDMYGIYLSSASDISVITDNKIHGITSSGTSGYQTVGINLFGDATVVNNMIYNLSGNGSAIPQVMGIWCATGSSFKLYYNTIFLKAGGTNASFGTAALYIYSDSPTLDIRNNVFVNLSTPGTGTNGRAAVIWKRLTGFAYFADTTDRNIYYAGEPGPKNMICFENGSVYQTLLDFKNAVMTFDQGSYTEDVPFVSIESPYDVHIRGDVPTRVEGNALPIAGWDLDLDGDARDAATPDVGADEGDFLPFLALPHFANVVSPADDAIVVSPDATLNWTASVEGGIPTGYKIYFGTNDPPSNIEDGTDLGNVFTYVPSAAMQYLTTYYWRIVPYNTAGDALDCPIWSFETFDTPLTGSYTIGSEGDFASFTLAITHLNASGVGTGGVTFSVAAGETFAENPPPITASGSAANPILFTSDARLRINPKITPSGGAGSYGIKIEGGDHIIFDHIDIANADSATNLVYGYWIEGQSANAANYNRIQNCGITLNRAVTSYGIYMTGASNDANIGNQISSNAIDNASNGIYLYPPVNPQSTIVQGNVITNATTNGIYSNNGQDTVITGNQISFPTNATVALRGIYATSHDNVEISHNVISGGNTSGTCTGIYIYTSTGSAGHNTISNLQSNSVMNGFDLVSGTLAIHDNEISGLSTNNHLYAINASQSTNTLFGAIYNNKIHNNATLTTGSQIAHGIYSSGSNTIYNNMISDLRNAGGTSAPQVRAIAVMGGALANLYHNSVYLDAAGTNANYSTAALYNGGGTTNLMINNIFVNAGTPGINGMSVAFWKVTEGWANINAASDNNIYWAGTPGPANLICYNATTAYQTLGDYKAAVASFDQGSFTEAVPFLSVSAPYDLHIDPAAPTRAESNAIPLAEVAFDLDGDPRNAITPDIGADEGDFLILLSAPDPAIVVAPTDEAYAQSRVPTLVWFPSASGGTATGYRLHFGTDPLLFAGEPGLDLGNVLSHEISTVLEYLTVYYWMIVPYNDQGDALNCPVWSFETHSLPISGTYTIGSSGHFPDFSHAINHLNAAGVGTGGVTFDAAAGEVFAENPPAITATGTISSPIVFQNDGSTRTNPLITPQGGANTFGIKIEGGDYITFDGIDIANAPGSNNLAHGYWLASLTSNGASFNTITNCAITLDKDTAGTYAIRSVSSAGRVNHSNAYLSNTIHSARYGIYLYDTSSVQNTLVQQNVITDVMQYGVYLNSATSAVISQNQITMAAANNQNFYGIYMSYDSAGSQISANSITGNTTSAYFYGMYLYSGSHTISSNTISGLDSSSRFWAISNYTGTLTIHSNQIHSLQTTNTSTSYGIDLSGSGSAYDNVVSNLSANGTIIGIYNPGTNQIYRNTIHNLQSTGTSSASVSGIVGAGGNPGQIYNNLIYDLRNPAGTTAPQVRGISISGGIQNVWYNSVLLSSSGTAANHSSAALYLSSTGGSVDLKNNIFDNRGVPGANGICAAFWKTPEGFSILSAGTNNNIWHAGIPSAQNLICLNGAVPCQTLEDYKAVNPGKDQLSFTEAVPFLSTSAPFDLHLATDVETVAEGNAIVISAITTDFDQDPRDALRPDIGADEGDFMPITGPPLAPANLTPANGATNIALNALITWAPGGGGLPTGYNVYFGTVTPPPLLTSVTATQYAPVLIPETQYYWRIESVNDLGNAMGAIWSFTTRNDYTIVEMPFLEGFETGNTQGSTTIYRWTQALGSGSNSWTVNSTATSYNRTPRSGSYNVTLAASGEAWLFRPIWLDDENLYELELWARQHRDSGSYALMEVKYGSSPEIAAMTNSIIGTTEFVNGDYQRAAGVIYPPATGLYYIGIHGTCTMATNFISLDDIGITQYYPSPGFGIAPPAWDFGQITVDMLSPAREFVITNSGDAELVISAGDIGISGTDPDHFILGLVEDDIILPPSQTQILQVTFAPLTSGFKYANLEITDNTSGRATHLIPLTGRGMGPLDPPFVMDFEDGLDDWVVVNDGQTNKWETGTATSYRNQKSAYISSNAGVTNNYSLTAASVVHFYHDIRFPQDVSNLSLRFNWKGMGEASYDYLSVHLTDTGFTPTAGNTIGYAQIGSSYQGSADWQYVSLPIDPANAGTIKRLIFTWRNDLAGGSQPPAAIDNIRIVDGGAIIPAPTNPGGSIIGGIPCITWDIVPTANEYIIEDADIYDGSFSPVGRSGKGIWNVPPNHPRRFFRVRGTD